MKTFVPFLLIPLLVACPVSAADLWSDMFNRNLEQARQGDATAARLGDPLAAARLQRMQRREARFARIHELAESGDADACFALAGLLLSGQGVNKDPAAARRWLEKAAAQQHVKATARLGILYLKGKGVDRDPGKAAQLLGSVSSHSVLAQYYLGEMYADGTGVRRDYQAAIDWFRKAADGGYPPALGRIVDIEQKLKGRRRR